MRIALHPAICGGDVDVMADYCRYMAISDLFYQLHDIEGYQDGALTDPAALSRLNGKFKDAGLRLSAVNDFLPDTVDAIERRREGLASTVGLLVDAGVETLILFVLQPASDELWKSIAGLYETVVPQAQSEGVKIATHGHWCEGRLAYNRDTLKRIIDCSPDSASGICLCAGCFHQAGDDPAAIVREMPDRIHCVHIRDTSLVGGCDLEELPLGSGTVPIADTLKALIDIGYTGLVIPEHLSGVNAQSNMEVTHAHAVGYIRGITRALQSGGRSK